MPYSVRKQNCTQSDGDKGNHVLKYTTKKGRKVSNCHTSKKKAQGQIAAIEGPRENVLYTSKRLGLEIIEHSGLTIFTEAEYKGKKDELGKGKRGGDKKFYVYVKNPKTGNTKKVSFGDTSGLSIKTKDSAKRKSFRARHKCDQKKDRTSAGYWSCRMWSGPDAVKNMLKK